MSNLRTRTAALVEAGRQFVTDVQTTPLRLGSFVGAYLVARNSYEWSMLPERNTLPEPLDVRDHVGNLPESLLAGSAAGFVVAEVAANVLARQTSTTIRRKAFVAAALAGMAVNAMAETKGGYSMFNLDAIAAPGYVPDQSPVDFAWGVGAAVLGAAMFVRPTKVRP